MKCKSTEKRGTKSTLVWQLLIVLTIAAMLMSSCGPSFPVYPGAEKSDDRAKGMYALAVSGISTNIQIGGPGGQIKINPQTYSTTDSLNIVKVWYTQKLTDWREVYVAGGDGVSFVFPEGCNASAGQCEKQLYVFRKASGGTWIVLFTL